LALNVLFRHVAARLGELGAGGTGTTATAREFPLTTSKPAAAGKRSGSSRETGAACPGI
jgi:hypothetical protein